MATKRGTWLLLVFVVLTLLGALWALSLAAGGRRGPAYLGWEEEAVTRGGPDKVALVRVEGQIGADAGALSPGVTAEEIVEQLDRAISDRLVEAVIVDLETPGGGVVASDSLHAKVREVRRKGKPVIALMRDVAASGGYYIAAAADEIVANPATITGSIGVILFVPNLERAADKIGVELMVIKSGPHKDIASPFREMTPEEAGILQTLIDEAYGQFVSVVAEGRQIDEQRVREIADGRIYTGRQAKELGLVDHLGGRDLALERARALGRAPGAALVRYVRRPGLLGSLLGLPGALRGQRLIPEGLPLDLRPGLKYLWLP